MKKFVVALITLLALSLSVAVADTLILPDDLTTIGTEAFSGTNAETIILPPGATTIEDNAFDSCNSLQTVYVPEALMDRERAALGNRYPAAHFVSLTHDWSTEYEYTVGDASVTITKYKGTDTEVSIPAVIEGKMVTVIGQNAFSNNTALTKAVIPEGVTELGIDAFLGCVNLTEITFPTTLRILGSNALRYCGSNSTKTFCYYLPDNLTEIAGLDNNSRYSFNDCPAVKVVTPDCATAKLLSAFQERQKEKAWFTFPGELDYRYVYFPGTDGDYDILHLMAYTGTATEINIPDHGTTSNRISVLHNSIFYGNTAVKKVVIPEGVTEIQYDVFFGCSALAEVDFPDTLTTIGRNAFNGCSSAVEGNVFLDLPANITLIEYDAFNNCKAKLCCDKYSDNAGMIPTATYGALGSSRWWGWADGPFRMTDCFVPYTYITDGEQHTIQVHRIELGGYVPEEETDWTQPVTIPQSVYRIGKDCFRNLNGLRSLIMPNYGYEEEIMISLSVQEIDERAFMSCSNLISIQFPEVALSHIAVGAFSGCGNNAALDSYTFSFSLPQTDTFGSSMTSDGKHVADCNAKFVITWIEVPTILN